MKYIVVGGGPSGLSLAYTLAINNKQVVLFEKDQQLGGSWNSQWIQDKYFSENSPRVYIHNDNAQSFMNHIGMDQSDFANVYGSIYQTNLKMLSFLMDHFQLKDYIIFFLASLKYSIIRANDTVQSWLDNSYMSIGGKLAIKIISILISDRPDKTNINDFFGMFGFSSEPIKQMKEPNKWHGLVILALRSLPNVYIYKNTTIINVLFDHTTNLVSGVLAQDNKTHFMKPYHSDRVVLCTQSTGILPILKNSDEFIQNNWLPYHHMKTWGKNTDYNGFGFQLHFRKTVSTVDKWCWSCSGEWTVIILPVSDWLRKFTKDESIKTVWSCCIVDMDTLSSTINKTVNECTDENEVVKECLRQIKNADHSVPVPDIITTSVGLKRYNSKWVSNNTGFTSSSYGTIPSRGKVQNLFALGCFTDSPKPSISYFGKSIDATASFLENHEPYLQNNIFLK